MQPISLFHLYILQNTANFRVLGQDWSFLVIVYQLLIFINLYQLAKKNKKKQAISSSCPGKIVNLKNLVKETSVKDFLKEII